MGKVPVDLRRNIAANIKNCRVAKYPMWGGAKLCAQAFGVTQQQWSQWERGAHMPDEYHMMQLASFFGVSTEWLRRDNSGSGASASSASEAKDEKSSSDIDFGAVRIDNGVEVPLKVEVEVERIVYYSNYAVHFERIR